MAILYGTEARASRNGPVNIRSFLTLKGLGISGGFTFLGTRSTWAWAGASGQKDLPDYTNFDGGIFWEHNNMRISCNVYNLADKYLYSGAPYGTYYYWQAEAGRNWRPGINYRF